MATLLPPTRVERYLRSASYLCIGLIGVAAVFWQPQRVEVLGQVMVVIWSLFVATAIPCAVAALRLRYRAEFTLIPFFGAALLVAVATLWYEFSIGYIAYASPRLLADSALLLLIAVRYVTIRRIVKTTTDKDGAGWTPHWFKRSRA